MIAPGSFTRAPTRQPVPAACAIRARTAVFAQARKRAAEVEGKISRALEMAIDGLMEKDDPRLREILDGLKAQRASIAREIAVLEAAGGPDRPAVTREKVERFAGITRKALASDDPAFRKAYLRLFVDTVVVGDAEVRIAGPTSNLAKAAVGGGVPEGRELVPGFMKEWREKGDSNER